MAYLVELDVVHLVAELGAGRGQLPTDIALACAYLAGDADDVLIGDACFEALLHVRRDIPFEAALLALDGLHRARADMGELGIAVEDMGIDADLLALAYQVEHLLIVVVRGIADPLD